MSCVLIAALVAGLQEQAKADLLNKERGRGAHCWIYCAYLWHPLSSGQPQGHRGWSDGVPWKPWPDFSSSQHQSSPVPQPRSLCCARPAQTHARTHCWAMVLAALSSHCSAGRWIHTGFSAVLVILPCPVCWPPDPAPFHALAGAGTHHARVMAQSGVASLASLDWKRIKLKMNPSVFCTALFILSNAGLWQAQALFIHHCCHLSVHLATEFWIGMFAYSGKFFSAYLFVLMDTSAKYLFESEILNSSHVKAERLGGKGNKGMFDSTQTVSPVNRSHFYSV